MLIPFIEIILLVIYLVFYFRQLFYMIYDGTSIKNNNLNYEQF